jgi:2-iminobutanoate/2-iminopropanoate deaminase
LRTWKNISVDPSLPALCSTTPPSVFASDEIDARKSSSRVRVAVNLEGEVLGHTIEEQTRATLDNCRRQLACAGASLTDVFNVNVYMSNLSEWARFNAVYAEIIPSPLPARTAVQAILLPNFRVEIEMWAVKPN